MSAEKDTSAPTSPSPSEGAASPADKPAPKARKPKARIETYEAVKPNGDRLLVTRNLDTGEATYKAL